MHALFERLTNEADRIGKEVFPAIEKQIEEAKARGDIEAMKDVLRKQREYNNRLAEIVQMLEKLTE